MTTGCLEAYALVWGTSTKAPSVSKARPPQRGSHLWFHSHFASSHLRSRSPVTIWFLECVHHSVFQGSHELKRAPWTSLHRTCLHSWNQSLGDSRGTRLLGVWGGGLGARVVHRRFPQGICRLVTEYVVLTNNTEELTHTEGRKWSVGIFISPHPWPKWVVKCWGEDKHLIDTSSYPKHKCTSNGRGSNVKATLGSFLLPVPISTLESQPFCSQTTKFPAQLSDCLVLVSESVPASLLLKLLRRKWVKLNLGCHHQTVCFMSA